MQLLIHPQGKLISQLQETAAWLAIMREELFDAILQLDPEALVNSDVTRLSPRARRNLVDALLRIHESKEILNIPFQERTSFSRFTHPELETQLRPYITDRMKNIYVRRFAIDIAEKCQLSELHKDLIEIALDPSQEYVIRCEAVHVIYETGSAEAKLKLKPLLKTVPSSDPNDELKGTVLLSLWPTQLTAKELFEVLTLPQRQNLVGCYNLFFSPERSVDYLKAVDLPIALAWVEQSASTFDDFHAFSYMADAIMVKAWEYLNEDNVLAGFAKAALSRLNHHYDIIGNDRFPKSSKYHDTSDFISSLRNDHERRHKVLQAMIPLVGENEDRLGLLIFGSTRLVGSEDVFWMIERLKSTRGEAEEKIWAYFIHRCFDMRNPAHVEAVYYAGKKSRELRQRVRLLFQAVKLSSQRAKKLRADHKRWKNLCEKISLERLIQPPPDERVQILLAKCETGNSDAWWQLTMEMTLEVTSRRYGNMLEADLKTLPGWINADEHTRSSMIIAAKQYLADQSPETDKWLGTDKAYFPALAGYKALFLLANVDWSYLLTLPSSIWQRWASIIVAYPIEIGTGKESPHQELVAQAYPHASEEMIATLITVIDSENREHGSIHTITKFANCWDNRLASAMLTKSKEESLAPRVRQTLFERLLEYGSVEARDYIVSLLSSPFSSEEAKTLVAVAVTALVNHLDQPSWELIWTAIQEDTDLGKEIVAKLAYELEEQTEKFATSLCEAQLADLFIWLSIHYPYEEDPNVEGFHTVSTREEIGWWRRRILNHLVRRGTVASIAQLNRIVEKFPHLDYLKNARAEASKITRHQTWIPPLPEEILQLPALAQIALSSSLRSTWEKRVQNWAFSSLGLAELFVFGLFVLWLVTDRSYEPAIGLLLSVIAIGATLKYQKVF